MILKKEIDVETDEAKKNLKKTPLKRLKKGSEVSENDDSNDFQSSKLTRSKKNSERSDNDSITEQESQSGQRATRQNRSLRKMDSNDNNGSSNEMSDNTVENKRLSRVRESESAALAVGNVQLLVNLIFILYGRWRFKTNKTRFACKSQKKNLIRLSTLIFN